MREETVRKAKREERRKDYSEEKRGGRTEEISDEKRKLTEKKRGNGREGRKE